MLQTLEAWNGKGMALADKGDLSGIAGLSSDGKSKLDPLNPGAWNNEGVALREQGKYQEALERFDKALLLDPNNQAAQTNRNNTLQDMNRIVQLGTAGHKQHSIQSNSLKCEYVNYRNGDRWMWMKLICLVIIFMAIPGIKGEIPWPIHQPLSVGGQNDMLTVKNYDTGAVMTES